MCYSASMFWKHPCLQPLLNTLFILYLRLCALFFRTLSTQGISSQNCVGSFISWTGWLVQEVGSASNMGQYNILETALDWLNLLHDSLLLPLWSYYHLVVPEKIHTPSTDGILEILVGGGGQRPSKSRWEVGLNSKKSSAGVISTVS